MSFLFVYMYTILLFLDVLNLTAGMEKAKTKNR